MMVASLLLSSALLVPPYAGDLDIGFGNGGKIGFRSDYGHLAMQPDGKVLQAEVDRSYHRETDRTIYSIQVSRHAPNLDPAIKDFHIDYSFGGSQGVLLQYWEPREFPRPSVSQLLIDSGGGVFVIGTLGHVQSEYDDNWVRSTGFAIHLNGNGSIDESFGKKGYAELKTGSDAITNADRAELTADGGLVIFGRNRAKDEKRGVAFKLDRRGHVKKRVLSEPIFSQKDDTSISGALLSDGRYVFAGAHFFGIAYSSVVGAYRRVGFKAQVLLSSGKVDTSFGEHGSAEIDLGENFCTPGKVLPGKDGSITLLGACSDFNFYGGGNISAVRLKANGGLDPTFGNQGILVSSLWTGGHWGSLTYNPQPSGLIDPSGKLIVVDREPRAIPPEGREMVRVLARFNSDGAFDLSFGSGGTVRFESGDGWAHNNGVLRLVGDRLQVVLEGGQSEAAIYQFLMTNAQ
jgi:uncharacterized delta-60 repeat protein